MINEEKIKEPTPEASQESQADISPEAYTETRTQEINKQISSYQGPKTSEDLTTKTNEIQENYQQYIEESDAEGNQEMLQLFQNKMQDEINFYEGEVKKQSDLERLKKASEIMTPDDFQRFESILGNHEGNTDNLYDLSNKVLHTTNNFTFGKMLDSNVIKTDIKKGGMYQTPGASFADGDFEKAATFQTLFDDQNTRSNDKNFNTEKYYDKALNFVKYFWDKNQNETAVYLSKISNGKKVETLDDAVKIAEGFKFKTKPKEIEDDPDKLAKLFGVTIVFNKEKLPELNKEGTEGIQQDFELRSHREGGVPIPDASTIFVPESQMQTFQYELQNRGLDHIEVRPSEELEAIRMKDFLDNK